MLHNEDRTKRRVLVESRLVGSSSMDIPDVDRHTGKYAAYDRSQSVQGA